MSAFTYAPCRQCRKLNRVSLAESNKEPICGNCKSSLPLHFGVVEVDGPGLQILVAKSGLPVVCDFWAPWCGPCRAFAPTFQQAASQFAGRLVFAKLNTEAEPTAGTAHGVRSIPTFIFFHQGKESDRLTGALPAQQFAEWLEEKLNR